MEKLLNQIRQRIQDSFSNGEYPGDSNLRNSDEGEEPFLLEAEFKGKNDWRTLSFDFIDKAPDGYASALSFFSAEAFRFYLPAYLLADLAGQLNQTDLVFYLTHGLTDATKGVQINPTRYEDLTWFEYVSDRYSSFTRTEARAIVEFLEHKRRFAELEFERDHIKQALTNYWIEATRTSAA